MTGRGPAASLAATIVVAAVALPALAQDGPATNVKLTVTPNEAGTPRRPQPIEIGVVVGPLELDPADAPVVAKGTILLGATTCRRRCRS